MREEVGINDFWRGERWFCDALMEYWAARQYTWVPPTIGVDLTPLVETIPFRGEEKVRIFWPYPGGPAHVGVQIGGKWFYSVLSFCMWVDNWEEHMPPTFPFSPASTPLILLEEIHEYKEERIEPLLSLFFEIGGRFKRATPKAKDYIAKVFAQEWKAVKLVELFANSRRLEIL